MSNRPDFIIIGAMKCATSTLHEQLSLQSGIFMSSLKEPNFFSDDHQYARGIEWYLSLFTTAAPGALCGESSTHYTKWPTYARTVERLHQHLPDIKLIYIMRHPIERLVSQYIHEWTQHHISVEINHAIIQHPELIYYSQYSRQLQPYLDTFSYQRILPVFFERLCSQPQQELERICAFIDYKAQPLWYPTSTPQNVSSERMRQDSLRDFIVEFPVLKALRRRFIPKSVRTWVRSLWTIQKKPEIKPQNIDNLKAIFDQDLAILGSWLGIDELTCDTFKAKVEACSWNWSSVR